MSALWDGLVSLFATTQQWLFEQLVQPALYALGLMTYAEQAFDATEFVLLGVIEIAVLYALLRPLESLRPAEAWDDRQGVGTDVLYTLLNRLGVIPLLVFAVIAPLFMLLEEHMRLAGYVPFKLEDAWPWLNAQPFAAFFVYLVVLDFAEYWRHRWQHRFAWWWALHAVHHSQRRMSFWTDSRNHVLDEIIAGAYLSIIALAIGVAPTQFVTLIIVTRFVEGLSHANVRLSFGTIGRVLLVSPHFHRVHHGIGVGHEGRARGHNFAVLFPLWDVVFGTADFRRDEVATGIRDQLDGRDYGAGFIAQHVLALKRMATALGTTRSAA